MHEIDIDEGLAALHISRIFSGCPCFATEMLANKTATAKQ